MYTTSLRYSTLSLVLLYPYMYSVDGAVKGGGWVEEIKKFLNMKIKKFSRNSGEICRIFIKLNFHVTSRNSDQFRIAYVIRMYCMKVKKVLYEITKLILSRSWDKVMNKRLTFQQITAHQTPVDLSLIRGSVPGLY